MSKKFLRILQAFIFISSFETIYAGEIQTPLEAVQALGHEMSEMRHMLEIYAMIGTGVSFRLPKEQMRTAIRQYEQVISEMEKQFPDPKVQQQIDIGRSGWIPVKKALETSLQATKPSPETMKEGAIFIHGNIRTVIKALEAMKEYMLTKADFKAIQELNAAIEIDASARRLSAHYAMWMWALPDPTIEAHWQKGIEIYTKSLAVLTRSAFASDPAFKKAIDTARQQLQRFIMMHKMAENKHFTPALAQTRAASASEAAMKMAGIILTPK